VSATSGRPDSELCGSSESQCDGGQSARRFGLSRIDSSSSSTNGPPSEFE
jgi:hypothetical protein